MKSRALLIFLLFIALILAVSNTPCESSQIVEGEHVIVEGDLDRFGGSDYKDFKGPRKFRLEFDLKDAAEVKGSAEMKRVPHAYEMVSTTCFLISVDMTFTAKLDKALKKDEETAALKVHDPTKVYRWGSFLNGKVTITETWNPTKPGDEACFKQAAAIGIKPGTKNMQTVSWEGEILTDGTVFGNINTSGFLPNVFKTKIAKISQKEPEKICDLETELPMLKESIDDVITLQGMSKNRISEVGSERHKIEQYRAELDQLNKFTPFDPRKARAKGAGQWVTELERRNKKLRDTHEKICRFQDKIIAECLDAYKDLLGDLDGKIAKAKCPEVKTALKTLKAGLEEDRDLNYMQLYFVSGQRTKFQGIAEKFIRENKFLYQAYWLLSQDYLYHGEMASGLFALRNVRAVFGKQLTKYRSENKKVPEDLAKQRINIENAIKILEIKFLRAVDKKVLGDAARVRALLWEELGRGEPSFWNLLTTGVPTWLGGFGRFWGDHRESGVEGRADSVGIILQDAAAQHVGLILILRFLEKGNESYSTQHLNKQLVDKVRTLDDIKRANNETLIKWVKNDFGHDLSPDRAKKIRAWIYQGFRNPDVARLMRNSLEEFNRYQGRPYYSPKEFEQTWYELTGDFFLNPIMVFSIFAPYAKLTTASGKWIAFNVKYMTAAEAAASKNFVQTLATLFRVSEVIRRASSSNTMIARRIRAVIKWNTQSSLLKQVFVESMIQTGAVQLAGAVGGLPGQIVAEVLTTLGVGDLDEAVKILQNTGVTRTAARQLASNLKEILDKSSQLRTQAKVVAYKNRIMSILQKLDMGEVIDDATKTNLRRSAQKLEELLAELGEEGGSDLMRMQMMQVGLTAHGLRALADGDIARARFATSVLDDVDSYVTKVAKQMGDGIEVANGASKKMIKTTPFPEAGLEELGDTISPTDKACKRVTELLEKIRNDGFKAADDALREDNFDLALRLYKSEIVALNTKLEQAVALGNKKAIKDNSEKLMLYLEGYAVARDVRDAARHIQPFAGVANDPVMKVIEIEEAQNIGAKITEAFSEVSSGRKQLDEILQPLSTSAGESTKDAPRRIVVNGETFLFKGTKNAKDEVFASRLAKKLDINSPSCAEVSWIDQNGVERHGIIQRFVADSSDLSVVDRGTALAAKRHAAEDMVLSVLLGDHDRRSRNFLVTSTGKVYSIDHGESKIIDDMVKWGEGNIFTEKNKQEILTGMQLRYRVYLSQMEKRPIIKAINMQIIDNDYQRILKRVKNLTQDDIEELLKGIYDRKKDFDNWLKAYRTIDSRIRYLEAFFQNLPKLSQIRELKKLFYSELVDIFQLKWVYRDPKMRPAA